VLHNLLSFLSHALWHRHQCVDAYLLLQALNDELCAKFAASKAQVPAIALSIRAILSLTPAASFPPSHLQARGDELCATFAATKLQLYVVPCSKSCVCPLLTVFVAAAGAG
jgi:hypothetical protein